MGGSAPAIAEGAPSVDVEAPADDKLHRGGAETFDDLVQREVKNLRLQQRPHSRDHGEHHGH